MRVIFVPVANRPECAMALQTALDLGQRLGASVCGCHIRPHSYSDVKLMADPDSLADYNVEWEAAWKGKKPQNSHITAKALFEKIAADRGYEIIRKARSSAGALWLEKVGSPDKVLSIMGPISDLIVVSRATRKGGKLARLFMLAALLNSSRPVLLLPQTGKATIGKRISIAWNQSPEGARAVAAAMPLLQNADQVNIITCGGKRGSGPTASQLQTYLRFWGIRAAKVTSSDADDAKGLLKGYKDTRSDLLVMGAYSRSRLRQQIFGGVTEHMLNRANIPVLMLHS